MRTFSRVKYASRRSMFGMASRQSYVSPICARSSGGAQQARTRLNPAEMRGLALVAASHGACWGAGVCAVLPSWAPLACSSAPTARRREAAQAAGAGRRAGRGADEVVGVVAQVRQRLDQLRPHEVALRGPRRPPQRRGSPAQRVVCRRRLGGGGSSMGQAAACMHVTAGAPGRSNRRPTGLRLRAA